MTGPCTGNQGDSKDMAFAHGVTSQRPGLLLAGLLGCEMRALLPFMHWRLRRPGTRGVMLSVGLGTGRSYHSGVAHRRLGEQRYGGEVSYAAGLRVKPWNSHPVDASGVVKRSASGKSANY